VVADAAEEPVVADAAEEPVVAAKKPRAPRKKATAAEEPAVAAEPVVAEEPAANDVNDEIAALKREIEALKLENAQLRNKLANSSSAPAPAPKHVKEGDTALATAAAATTWTEHFSQKFQRPYWYNSETKLSSWTKPANM
jgi:hypothetical protein